MLVHPTTPKSTKNRKRKPKLHTVTKSKEVEFEPLAHSVYSGRQRLGRYVRVGPRKYAAYDADDCLLGEFKSREEAYSAVGQNSHCCQT
jgi:hypothetical protein